MFGSGMGTLGTPRKTKLANSPGYLARPRLGALKNYYASSKTSQKSPNVHGLDKKKKIKKPVFSKNEPFYRKKPDCADNAYREAVSRLRILLAESYTPIRRPFRELDSAGEETDNQSIISVISRSTRYPHYHGSNYLLKKYPYYPTRNVPAEDKQINSGKYETNPELTSFIERQEDYIEQLERESRFCREELSTLLGKVKEVISENETLHEKQKNSLMKSVFDQFETETETENDDLLGKSSLKPKKQRVLEGPSIVFESRISELEAQLTQTKIDLKKCQEENEGLRKNSSENSYNEGFDSFKKQVESLQREKSALQETVTKLQSALNVLRDKEYSTSDQVKRSLDVAEQAQYEKNAAEHEIRRLKDELERQHGKLRDAINDQSRKVADERAAVERRYSQQIEQLTTELGVHWEQSSKLQLEVDKQRRENTDLRRELAQKMALIDELRKEMQNKIITLQSDIGVTGAEKSALEQQIATLQMANDRCERQGKQETARMQVEMQSLRQRLDRADSDLIHSKRENVRLAEQIASLQKELNMNAALADERSRRSEVIPLPAPKHDEKDMSTMIKEMEAKHVATVAELEGMIQSQNQLMDKLSSECQTLTQKLEESSMRHKEEIRGLQTNLDYLSNRFCQSQIKPSSFQEEISVTPRNAPHEEKAAPILSRTSSKSSVKQTIPQPELEVHKNPPGYNENTQQNSVDQKNSLDQNSSEINQSFDKNKQNHHEQSNENYVASENYDPSSENYEQNHNYGQENQNYEPQSQYEGVNPNYENQQYESNQEYSGLNENYGHQDQQYLEQADQNYGDLYPENANYDQQYDPNQAYETQQQYDETQQQYDETQQQYGNQYEQYDPNIQYAEGQDYKPTDEFVPEQTVEGSSGPEIQNQ